MAVDAHGYAELSAEVDEELGVVEVVHQPRDAIAVSLQCRERAHRLAVDVLVPVQQEPPAAMRSRLTDAAMAS